jgi:ribosomal protein S18 acetylase RimI-like enzyme
MQIRKVTLADINHLQRISSQTFIETFAAINTEENMSKYLEEALSLSKLNNEISDPNSEFYFASINNNVVGYLKLNFDDSQTDLKDPQAVEVERIYVIKEYLGKNVGQTLYNKAIQVSQQRNANYVWLGVWENNQRAISFYRKNGFVEFGKHIFRLGDDNQIDIMMKLKLKKSAE